MSKKLYLHIGSHKTGTTSIQEVLFNSADYLQQFGISVFYQQIQNAEILKGSINSWFDGYENPFEKGINIAHKAILANEMSKLNGDVIASSEQFSYVFDEQQLNDFKKELDKYFDEIKIIVYLRRQDLHMLSHHQQSAYRYFEYSTKFFGNEPIALPTYQKHFDLYLDYHKRLLNWLDIFGQENMIIRLYDNLYKNNSVDDFFQLFGIEGLHTLSLNKSKSFEKAKIGFLCNQFHIHRDSHLSHIIQRFTDAEGKLLPSKQQAEQFYERYKESNQLLNKQFKLTAQKTLFNDDFSMYPNERKDMWTEETANKAISNLLCGMSQTYGKMNLQSIINAALKLENTDVKLSLALMVSVQHILPNHIEIKNKIVQYEKKIREIS